MWKVLSVLGALASALVPFLNWLAQKWNPDNSRVKILMDYDNKIQEVEEKIDEIMRKQKQEVRTQRKKDLAVELGNFVNQLVFLRKEREKYLKRY